jgi:hypothetical protein
MRAAVIDFDLEGRRDLPTKVDECGLADVFAAHR